LRFVENVQAVRVVAGVQPGSVVLVDCVGAPEEATNIVIQLQEAVSLHAVPTVFVATDSVKKTKVLVEQFKFFVPVNIPYRVEAIAEAVKKLCALPQAKKSPETVSVKVVSEPEERETEIHHPPTSKEAMPKRAASTGDLKPPSRKLKRVVTPIDESTRATRKRRLKDIENQQTPSSKGGAFLAKGGSLEDFDDEQLVPNHPQHELINKTIDHITEKDEWLGLHSRRVALVSSAVADGLALGPERDSTIRTSGLLLNLGLVQENHVELSRADLLNSPSSGILEQLGETYKSTAELVHRKLDDEFTAKIIDSIGSVLLNTAKVDAVSHDAQCALAMEVADRSCWRDGVWDPYGAYRAMKSFNGRGRFHFEDDVNVAVSQVLGEAAMAKVSIRSAFPVARQTKEQALEEEAKVQSAFEEAERLFGLTRFLSVTVQDLKPGMLLARPLLTNDGKVILMADTRLTQDIISRIWTLAAVRPLQNTVAIVIEANNLHP
jgi:response regulator RpfG family c-di-GMP phosphodiesterase